jgi:uncharacterized membrane protein
MKNELRRNIRMKNFIKNQHLHISIFSWALVFLILAIQPFNLCAAQLSTEIKCPDYWQVTYPDKIVSFELTVTNPSYYYDNFVLDISNPTLPEGWRADFYSQNKKVKGVGIEGLSSITLTLKVTVPEDAFPSDYQFAAYANGQYSEAHCLLTMTIESEPTVEYEVDIYCSNDWLVTYPGNNLTFNLRVTNNAPYRDNYLININNPALPTNWSASFTVEENKVRSISLASEESVNLIMVVNVPKGIAYRDYQFRVNINGDYASTSQGLTVTVERVPRKISLECPIEIQSVLTGQNTYFPIKVVNEGSQTENIFLTLIRTSAIMIWDITFSESQLTLVPGGSAWVRLIVKSPGIVDQGNYTIELEAKAEDGELKVPLIVVTNIVGSYLLEIADIAPVNPQLYQGDKINVVIRVRNAGQSPVTGLRLIVNSTGLSNILVTPMDVTFLEAMTNADFTLRVSADPNLTPGDYVIQVQAQGNEIDTSIREFTISVSSQIPWTTIIIAIAVVATAIVVLIVQSLIRKAGVQVKIRK